MIKRIFKVTIDPALRQSFENDFLEISGHLVAQSEGLISMVTGKPTRWNPDEYLMISSWAGEAALVLFAGPDWNNASIPPSMEKYAKSYSVDHFYVED